MSVYQVAAVRRELGRLQWLRDSLAADPDVAAALVAHATAAVDALDDLRRELIAALDRKAAQR